MLHVINLKPRTISKPLPATLQLTSTMGFYIAVSLLLSSLFPKAPIRQNALVNPLSQHAQKTAQDLAPKFRNAALAINFFCNERALGKTQSSAFKSSGTAHLLAISGGQVAFLAPVLSAILTKPILILLARRVSPLTLMTLLTRIKGVSEVLTAAVCAAMFGATGSLLRTTGGKLSSAFPPLTYVSHLFFTSQTMASHKSIHRILILFLLVPVLGNPLQDLSFLFSALGASILTLSSVAVRKLFCRRQLSGFLFQSLATTTITSGCISIVLCPISNTNPLSAILANMVAIPLVTFWICPLSLLILLVPAPAFQHLLIPILDAGLSALLACAQAFSDENGVGALPFFTAKHYLLLCVATCWTLEDINFRKRPL
jgi:hypothetical protein